MDAVITVPKTIQWETFRKELDDAAEKDMVLNFRVPTQMRISEGDKVYIVHDGAVRGYHTALGCQRREAFTCETTGKQWPAGWYLQRTGKFHEIDPIPMKGFQGARYMREDTLEEGAWDAVKASLKDLAATYRQGKETGEKLAQKLVGKPKPAAPKKAAPGGNGKAISNGKTNGNGHMSKEAQAAAATGVSLDVDEYFKGTPKKGELSITDVVRHDGGKSFYGTFDGRELVFKVDPERISLYAKGAIIPAASAKIGKGYGDSLRELDIAYRLAKTHSEKLAAAEEEFAAGKAIHRLRKLTDLIRRMEKGEQKTVNFQIGGKPTKIQLQVIEAAIDAALDHDIDEATRLVGELTVCPT